MNHYHKDGERYLFVAMTKDGHCIRAEGAHAPSSWKGLADQARWKKEEDTDE